MVALSIMIEGQDGLTWARWKKLVEAVESLGFAGLFRSDHFTNVQPPDKDSLEMVVSLTYLAAHSQRLHFGPLVAPLSVRDPMLLVRQAAALDDLSNGRMILGLGAGWQEREHSLFGYELGAVKTRMARLEEGLEVVTRLLSSDEPVSYDGQFYKLRGATLLPHPQRPRGPRILIGGNGRQRTLGLAARYADIWNAVYLPPEAFKDLSTTLDGLLLNVGRKPSDVQRTMMTNVIFGRNMAELEGKLQAQRNDPRFAGKSLDEIIGTIATAGHALIGTSEIIKQQIAAYAQAGVEELMLQWFDMDDIDGLQAFAQTVLHS